MRPTGTFRSVDRWLKELREFGSPQLSILLVGNKADLQQLRAVSGEEAQAYCSKHGLAYIETSAKDASNVAAAF